MNHSADVIALCGDLTDYGLNEEVDILVEEIHSVVQIPVIAVLGNHDFESDNHEEVSRRLSRAEITVLDGNSCEFFGVGFVGLKGFCGGFGKCALEPWGESFIKNFVKETCAEALKLESALAKLRTEKKVVILHYSPIIDTVQGEPPEIFAFLGSSRLEEPINRLNASLVIHGHAHRGSPEGLTASGIPVYNVAKPLLTRVHSTPYRIFEI
jgi:Icc-related predicted phosphoesterase